MTTPKALAAAMQRRDADSIMLREMQQMLRAELEKPPEAQNLDAVDELTAGICEICGLEQAVAEHSRKGLETFRTNITPQIAATDMEITREPITVSVKPKRFFRWKRLAALAASFAGALMIGNFATKGALGDNLLNTGARLIHGGVDFTMSEPENVTEELPDGIDDPYGIQSACNALGFSVLTPQYLPDGLTVSDYETRSSELSEDVMFWFQNENDTEQTMFLHFKYLLNNSEDPVTGIPTKDYEPTEIEIKGIPINQVIDDDCYTSTFRWNDITYVVACKHLATEDCEQILQSFFDNTNL